MTIRERKRQKRLITSLVIILIIVLCIFMYFLIKKINVPEKFKVGKKNITYEIIQENELKKIVSDELTILDGKDLISDLNNQEKLLYSVNSYLNKINTSVDNKSIDENDNSNKEIVIEELTNLFNNTSIGYLGLTYEDITDREGNILLKYDKSSNKYVINDNYYLYNNNIKRIYEKEINFYQDNNRYVIEYYFLFGIVNGNNYIVYTSYNDAVNNENSIGSISINDDINSFYSNNYNDIKDKLISVSYTFEKVENKIKLIEYKKST